MAVDLLDVGYYKAVNSDLASFSDEAARNHFFTSGIDEGRTFSRFVDLNYYRASNSDLGNVGLTSNRQLYDHLSGAGVAEGRRFSRFFDVTYYGLANPDLGVLNPGNERVFNEALFSHAQSLALNEGRRFSPFFDVSFYGKSNPDLAANGLTTNAALFDHFRRSGVDEIRRFSQFIDLDYYRNVNQDLLNLVNQGVFGRRQLFEHLHDAGVVEGRKFSPLVDVDFYLNADPDVSRQLGSDRLQGFESLQTTGLVEGRRFLPIIDLNLYRAINLDLAAAFSTNNLALFEHLIDNGIAENRRFSLAYDTNSYRSVRTDLQALGFNNLQLLEHFSNNGINEGAVASANFSADVYLANNPDLSNLGFTRRQALDHYVTLGFHENRQATSGTGINFSGDPGDNLDSAGNLGVFSNRFGAIINQALDVTELGDVYRFTISAPSNLGIQVTGLSQPVRLELMFDADFNRQIDGGEIIQSSSSGNLNSQLGIGTYYLRVVSTTPGSATNYQVNLFPTVLTPPIQQPSTQTVSIIQSVDPGNTINNALNLGVFRSSTEISLFDFVGSADRNDFYRFQIIGSPANPAFDVNVFISNLSTDVSADLILDLNRNGQIDAGDEIRSGLSNQAIVFNNALPEELNEGIYFLRVNTPAFNSNTSYTVFLDLIFDL